MTLTRGITRIEYGLVSNNDQLIREGIQILEHTGYERGSLFARLVEAKTEQQYRTEKRKLYTLMVSMSGGGKKR